MMYAAVDVEEGVVWGTGDTEEEALADGQRWLAERVSDESVELTMFPITAELRAKIEAGDVEWYY